LKRKLGILHRDEGFFELHTCTERSRSSSATEGEKDKILVQNSNFLANLKKSKSLQYHGFIKAIA